MWGNEVSHGFFTRVSFNIMSVCIWSHVKGLQDLSLLFSLSTKIHTVKAMVFTVVMYGYETWTIKKTGCWRINAFELWCWKRIKSPLDSKEIKPVRPKGNQSWIFIGRTDDEAEAPILWPPDTKAGSLAKTLMLGKIESWRRRGRQRTRWLDDVTDSVDHHLREILKDREAWCAAVHGVTESQTWLSGWTTTNSVSNLCTKYK